MKVKIHNTKVDEDTFSPTLVLYVELDVEHITNMINKEGLDFAKMEVGDKFFEKLDQVLEGYNIK